MTNACGFYNKILKHLKKHTKLMLFYAACKANIEPANTTPSKPPTINTEFQKMRK
ncbi:MAG: hypothetical protein ACETWM_19930 [Candidatus Lokiarchaeia archaeon]